MHRNSAPLIVPFRWVDEMRWAYRRLALLGVPIEFVYMGGVTPPQRILHLYPADGVVNEGGWGYVAALGDVVKIRGKRWFAVSGYSQLMPEAVLDWLTEEAGEFFLRGEVFVAPAELIGIDPAFPEKGTQALEDITGGRRTLEVAEAGTALMNLDLPYIDAMSPYSFRKFLSEHENELIRFRSAFKKLVSGVPSRTLQDVLDEIRCEVAAVCQSERFASLRKSAVKLGGALATVSAGIAAATAMDQRLAIPVAATAGAAAAASVLTDLWKERIKAGAKLRESAYFLALKLGLDKPTKVRRGKVAVGLRKMQRIESTDPGKLSDFHWLCPPTPGLQFLAFKK